MKPRNTTNQDVGISPSTPSDQSSSEPGGFGSSGSKSQMTQKSTPEELHDRAKNAVSKGLAAAAGVLEGFAERMRDDHIADKASDSIHQAGDVTIKVTQATREEADKIQSEFRHARVELGGESNQSTLPSGPGSEDSERTGMLRRSSRR